MRRLWKEDEIDMIVLRKKNYYDGSLEPELLSKVKTIHYSKIIAEIWTLHTNIQRKMRFFDTVVQYEIYFL